MNDLRYQELMGDLLEGELDDSGIEELTAGVRSRPELLRDLRRQLVLWEVWSQDVASHRSAEMFLAGWRTRLRAEADGNEFVERVKGELRASDETRPSRKSPHAKWVLRLLAGAAGLAISLALVAAGVYWRSWSRVPAPAPSLPSRPQDQFAAPRPPAPPIPPEPMPKTPEPAGEVVRPQPAELVTVTGEGVCTNCGLHESGGHGMAIRVTEDATNKVVYVQPTAAMKSLQGAFCQGRKTLVAKGTLEDRQGRAVLAAQTLEVLK